MPTNLTFVAGDGQATLNWGCVTGATSYNLYWGVTALVGVGYSSVQQNLTDGPYTLKPLSNGVTYYAMVTAVTAAGETSGSNQATGTPESAVPPQVRWVLPADGGVLSVTSPIEIGFTQDMDPSTVVAANITVTASGGAAVSGSVTYADRIATFTPTNPLDFTTEYTVSVGPPVANALGLPLTTTSSTSFLTKPPSPDVSTFNSIEGDGALSLTFTPITGSLTRVYLAPTTSTAPPPLVCETAGDTCTIFGLNDGTLYQYTVTSVLNGVEGDPNVPLLTDNPESSSSTSVPATPTGVRARPGNGSVYLDWNNSYSATTYDIYRATQSGGPYTHVVGPITNTRYNDTTAPNGQAAYYIIQPGRLGTPGAFTAEVSATPESTYLKAPQVSMATGNGWAQLTWPAVTGAVRYVVLHDTNTTTTMTPTAFPTDLQFLDDQLSDGSPEYYTVYAVDSSGNGGSYSTELVAQPVSTGAIYPALPVVRATSTQVGKIWLEWDSIDGATDYTVFRGTASGVYNTTEVRGSGAQAFLDSVTPGQTYYYTVQPTNGTEDGGYSTEVSATAMADVVNAGTDAPTGLQVAPGQNSVTLTWTPVAGASSYLARYSTTSGQEASGSAVATSDNSAVVTIAGLQTGQIYYFVVESVFGVQSVTSTASSEVSATPSATFLTAPSFSQYQPGSGEVELGWDTVPGAILYNVYRRDNTTGWAMLGSSATLGYRDTTPPNGFSVEYSIQASTGSAAGPWSYPVTVQPASYYLEPTGLTATSGDNCITFNWQAVPNATYYEIWYGTTSGGPYTNYIGNTNPADTTLTECSTLNNGASYYASVQAYNSRGLGGFSTQVKASPNVASLPQMTTPTAVAGNLSNYVYWTGVSGFSGLNGYNLYRRTTASPWVKIATVSAATIDYLDTAVVDEDYYSYMVQPTTTSAIGPDSNASYSTPLPAEAPPTLTADVGNGYVTFHVGAVPSATGYELYYGSAAGGPYETYLSSTYNISTDVTVSMTNGTTYYVVADTDTVNGIGTSGYSPAVTVTPSASLLPPPTLNNAFGGDREVFISWSAVTGATSYNVYRRISGTYLPWILAGSTTEASLRDLGVTNGQAYDYVVQAVDAAGKGPWSTSLTTTPMGIPVVDNVQVIPGSDDVSAVWDAIPGATYYYVYTATTPGGPYSYYTYTSLPFLTLSPTSPTTPHYVSVAAYETGLNEGAPSYDSAPVASNTSLPLEGYVEGAASTSATSIDFSFTYDGNPSPSARVWRSTDGGTFEIIGDTPTPFTFDDVGLTTGVDYSYTFQVTGEGESALTGNTVNAVPN